MTVILDVLVQRNAVVSITGVNTIANAFPDQALIFVARLPFRDAEPLLLTWYQDGQAVSRAHLDAEGANRLMLARVAAMMLAKGDPQTIAPGILADSVERLVVSVSSEGLSGVDRCLVGCAASPVCADEPVDDPQAGWPPVYRDTLEENMPLPFNPDPILNGLALLEAGGDRITYDRGQGGSTSRFLPLPRSTQRRDAPSSSCRDAPHRRQADALERAGKRLTELGERQAIPNRIGRTSRTGGSKASRNGSHILRKRTALEDPGRDNPAEAFDYRL